MKVADDHFVGSVQFPHEVELEFGVDLETVRRIGRALIGRGDDAGYRRVAVIFSGANEKATPFIGIR